MKLPLLICIQLIGTALWSQDSLFYDTGELKAVGLLIERSKEGKWDYFYPNEKLSAQFEYVNDRLNGYQYYYDLSVNLIAKEWWESGLQQDSSWYYHSNGVLEKKGIFLNGLYEGKWIFKYSNGNLKRVGFYQQGIPNGNWEFYFENGSLNQTGMLKNGKEEGEWKYFDEEGNPTYLGSWKEGVKVGQWYYYRKGVKKKWKKF